MAPLLSLIIILSLSMLITYIAAVALNHTGLSKEVAMFQARSAFTGVGFTTNESEKIVEHPVRRKIVLTLMLVGNVGVISAIASLLLTFMDGDEKGLTFYYKIAILIGSIVLLWLLSRSKWVEKNINYLINRALKRFTSLHVRDYVEILHLSGEYEVTTLRVEQGDWIADKKVSDCSLREEGINIIGIKRHDGSYLGIVNGDTSIEEGDHLILYGRESALKNLDERKKGLSGDSQHREAVDKQKSEKVKQDLAEDERKEKKK
jgi:uncharacterized membrane protein YeaQ/YmgE (transglycosylase-associated protein family)